MLYIDGNATQRWCYGGVQVPPGLAPLQKNKREVVMSRQKTLRKIALWARQLERAKEHRRAKECRLRGEPSLEAYAAAMRVHAALDARLTWLLIESS